ncbi:MAG: hypothetical protein MHM6MM_002521 [Cercozoa sp. M6MM]
MDTNEALNELSEFVLQNDSEIENDASGTDESDDSDTEREPRKRKRQTSYHVSESDLSALKCAKCAKWLQRAVTILGCMCAQPCAHSCCLTCLLAHCGSASAMPVACVRAGCNTMLGHVATELRELAHGSADCDTGGVTRAIADSETVRFDAALDRILALVDFGNGDTDGAAEIVTDDRVINDQHRSVGDTDGVDTVSVLSDTGLLTVELCPLDQSSHELENRFLRTEPTCTAQTVRKLLAQLLQVRSSQVSLTVDSQHVADEHSLQFLHRLYSRAHHDLRIEYHVINRATTPL